MAKTTGDVVVERPLAWGVDTAFEPPMPASVQPKQALHLVESLARGEPDRGKIIASILKDQVRELV